MFPEEEFSIEDLKKYRDTTIFKYVCVVEHVDLAEIKITGLKSWDSSEMLFTIN